MQIRYRITLVYTSIVTIILLLLCSSIYYFSNQNRKLQFHERLVRKAISTADLLWKYKMDPELVRKINRTSPSALVGKAIYVYDDNFRPVFSYHDHATDSIHIDNEILRNALMRSRYFFTDNDKDAVAISYKRANQTFVITTAALDADRKDWLPKLRLILLVSFVGSVSVVVITGYIFSISLVQRMSSLTNRINLISSAQFSERLAVGSGKDELQKLAVTINHLLDRLQSSFDTQRRFIDNASHELSTPLASVASQLDVALQKEREPAEYREVMQSVKDDIRRLGVLVKSLLEIAKISGSAKGIELSMLRIDEVLMRLPGELKKVNSAYEVKLFFQELPDDDSALMVYGNEELLFSAIKNIVQNACKFSNSRTAEVKLYCERRRINITVEDKGPGIAPEELGNIFQPFFRSQSTTNIAAGFGLGLPLANQIIKLYGGTLTVKSELGKGSVFSISLKTASSI
jgi:two-component system, OmpR family, sensor histidine kinase ArlS